MKATGRVMAEMDDGSFRPVPIEDLAVPTEPPPEPPPVAGVFFDGFRDLSIEDGQAPTRGRRYVDSFAAWGVRRLANAPNLDQGVKRFVEGVTHAVGADGLHLMARPTVDERTGYVAGMISTERSFSMTYGDVDLCMKVPSLGPGLHLSSWLMPADGGGLPEYDQLELIGSNRFAPNGPINAVFMNAKNDFGGHWRQFDVRPGWLNDFHDYRFSWRKSGLTWFIDGQEVHQAPNLYDEPMYWMLTWEVGASSNKDFPGPIMPGTPWPAVAVVKSVKLTPA